MGQILRMLHTFDRQGLWSNWEDLGENIHAIVCSAKTELGALQNINSLLRLGRTTYMLVGR